MQQAMVLVTADNPKLILLKAVLYPVSVRTSEAGLNFLLWSCNSLNIIKKAVSCS